MKLKKYIPDFITSLRIIGALIILFLRPLSKPFFIVYTLSGVTDALDGPAARKLGAASNTGARLDSVADLSFYTISLAKLLPVLWRKLPWFIWIIVGIILFLRILSYIIAAVRFHRFASHHTWLNKITGAAVFAVPYFLITRGAVVYCFIVCAVGILSTAEDLYIHLSSSEYSEDIRSAL